LQPDFANNLMKPTYSFIFLISLLSAGLAEAKWQRSPTLADRPVEIGMKGVASKATLDATSGIGKSESLLSDDPIAESTVAAGNSSAVINLGRTVLLTRSSFTNDGIEGRATLSGSADKKAWATLDEKVFTGSDREVTFSFAGMQTKFIKIEFVLSKGGTIRNFQMFGDERDKDYYVKQTADGKGGYPVNLTNVGGSRVIYAAPAPAGGLDESATYNKFEFPASDERYRTLIYDMGQVRKMNQFGSVHTPVPVRFEVFAFDALPEKEDWRGRLAFDPTVFNVREPVASAEDPRGLGYVNAKPLKMVSSRYVALRWEPDYGTPQSASVTPAGNENGPVVLADLKVLAGIGSGSFGVSAPQITGSGFPGGSPGSGSGGPGGQAASNPGHTANGGAAVGDAGNSGNGGGTGGGGTGGGGQGNGTDNKGQEQASQQTGQNNVPFTGSPSANGVGLSTSPPPPSP
jgi:hypothetical protein